MLINRYRLGRGIASKHRTRTKMWQTVISKYHGLQAVESASLEHETRFHLEVKNLDFYFWKQEMNYVKELKMRSVKAAHRAAEEFKEKEWLLDTAARTWTHLGKKVVMLDRADSTTRQVLLNKLMMQAAKTNLPSDKIAQATVEEIYETKNAM